MNKYDKLFEEIEVKGSAECERIAKEILDWVEATLGFPIDYGDVFKNATGMVNTNKVLWLLTLKPLQPLLLSILEEYDYNPEIINTVSGDEIESEIKRITTNDDLEGKTLLLRLALEKQIG